MPANANGPHRSHRSDAMWPHWYGHLSQIVSPKQSEKPATHEDFEDLKNQAAALKRTTAEIEAEIKGGLWDKQKRWELRRDVVFDCVKRIAQADEALVGLHALHQVPEVPNNIGSMQARHDRIVTWVKASADLDESKLTVAVTCSKETKEAVEGFASAASRIARQLTAEKIAEAYTDGRKELAITLFAARAALRKELGIEAEK
jgi:hypothetical protein